MDRSFISSVGNIMEMRNLTPSRSYAPSLNTNTVASGRYQDNITFDHKSLQSQASADLRDRSNGSSSTTKNRLGESDIERNIRRTAIARNLLAKIPKLRDARETDKISSAERGMALQYSFAVPSMISPERMPKLD